MEGFDFFPYFRRGRNFAGADGTNNRCRHCNGWFDRIPDCRPLMNVRDMLWVAVGIAATTFLLALVHYLVAIGLVAGAIGG